MQENVGLTIEDQQNVAVVSFQATSISSYDGIAEAAQQIHGYIDGHQPDGVIFDFSKVKFFSSQVLGLLLEMRAKVQDFGGDVAISSIDPKLHRVFSITNLDKIFQFFPDSQSAVEAIGND